MCGITGYVGPPDEAMLTSMRDALVHRGPDGAGNFVSGSVSLGHRRLAIVDRLQGGQPMTDAAGLRTIVFNGEIYNHLEIRHRLAGRGRVFHTASDTETLLAAYAEYGPDCLSELRGMFAFVVYDAARRWLFGARDPMGEKPLYYSLGDDKTEFAFASEPKAFRPCPDLAGGFKLSPSGLRSYLLHDYTTGPNTIYSGVRRLKAGHAFTFGLEGCERVGFHEWKYQPLNFRRSPTLMNDVEAGAELIELLEASVRRQLMSDVPLGVFLSGGVDSSTVAALLALMKPASEVEAFSIGFDDPSFDESAYSASVASDLGIVHHHRVFSADDLLARLPMLARHMDEPFADPSLLPVSLLSEFARERVTVALGGDGGDELFAGYDPFRALAPARLHRRFSGSIGGRWVGDWAAMLANRLPASDRNMGWQFRLARYLQGVEAPPEIQSAAWMGPFTWRTLGRIAPDLLAGVSWQEAYAEELAPSPGVQNDLDGMLDFFQRIYLPDDILVKVDRAAMQYSLEVRCPFLDLDLVAFANGLPGRRKLHRGRTKVLLKQAVLRKRLLPKSIVHRKKKGFGIPAARWLKKELKEEFESRVLRHWPTDLPPLARGPLTELWNRHLSGAGNHYKELWALLWLAWWFESHG